MSVMTTYLNRAWKMTLTHAAAVVNLFGGTVPIIQWGMHFIVVAKTGNYRMIWLSRCAITTGFTLLTMSTPPVLHRVTGTCSAYEAECIGKVQKILFYTALPLIALGASGGYVVEAFREEQLIEPLLEGTKMKKFCCCSVHRRTKLNTLQFLVSVLVLVAIAYIKPWLLRFGIATICTLVASLILLISIRPIKAQGSLFTAEETKSILRMSPVNLFLILIGVVSALGNTYFTNQASKMDHTVGFFKVSILFLTLPRNMVQKWLSRSKWCTNTIGPKIGILLSMVLAVLCCIISAVIERKRLDVIKSHGLLDKPEDTIPMTIFWLLPQFILLGGLRGLSENSIVHFFTDVVLRLPKKNGDVETKEESKPAEQDTEDPSVHILKSPSDIQTEVIKRTGKDGEVPNPAQDQSKSSTEKDSNEKKVESKRQYIEFFVDAVSGVGTIFSVLVVYVVGQIEPSWFQDTLNRSHLDYYYWTLQLAALSGANLLLFVPVVYLLGPEKHVHDHTNEGADDEEPIMDKDEFPDLEANIMEDNNVTGSSLARVNSNTRKRTKSKLVS